MLRSVVLSHTSNFKGLMLASCNSGCGSGSTRKGTFSSLPSNTKQMSCSGGGTITHSSATSRGSVTMTWTAPTAGSGSISFRAAMVTAYGSSYLKPTVKTLTEGGHWRALPLVLCSCKPRHTIVALLLQARRRHRRHSASPSTLAMSSRSSSRKLSSPPAVARWPRQPFRSLSPVLVPLSLTLCWRQWTQTRESSHLPARYLPMRAHPSRDNPTTHTQVHDYVDLGRGCCRHRDGHCQRCVGAGHYQQQRCRGSSAGQPAAARAGRQARADLYRGSAKRQHSACHIL